jgi:hypothetical protein
MAMSWSPALNSISPVFSRAEPVPFALLGALIGGADELSWTDFGSSPSELSKDRDVKAEKVAKALAPSDRAPPADDALLAEQERAAALQALFRERVVVPKENEAAARKAQGQVVAADFVPRGDLPVTESESLLRQTIVIEAEDYADLARERAEQVQESLTAVDGVAGDRVFVATAKAGEAPKRQALLELK